jgi:hypothetical protein
MLFKFTAAGDALFRSNPSTFNIDKVVLGDEFGYTLEDPPVDIEGSAVYTSIAVLSKTVISANTIRFVKLLDNTVGDFDFGEVACYSGSTIVAVGVNPTSIEKTSDGVGEGNSIGLNIFLSNSNDDAYGFLQVTNSSSNLAVSQINHVDYLTPPYDGEPNIYVINGLTPEDTPTLAFSDSYGRWNFSTKPETYYEGTVFGPATFTALDIENPHGADFLSASQHFLQFTSGGLRGYCRQLTSIGTEFFQWNTPFTTAPQEGDTFIIVGPQVASGGGGGDFQAKIQFKDDGTNQGGNGTTTSVDFVGAGVTVTNGYYNDITVTIPGSEGGVSFPLEITDYSDETPTAIAWTNGSITSANTTRIRGVTYQNDGGRIWTLEAYINGGWGEAMALRRPNGECDVPFRQIYIPNLEVGNLTGISYVQTVSPGSGLRNTGDTSNVSLGVNAPQSSRQSVTPLFSTVQTYVSNTFTIGDVTTGSVFRITAYGTCSSAAADTVTFRVKYGANGNTADADIATLGTTAAGTGSNIPFKLEILLTVYQAASSIGIIETTASLLNGGATGSDGVWVNPSAVFTPQQATGLNTSVTSTRLGLSAQTSANSTTLIFQSVVVESVR